MGWGSGVAAMDGLADSFLVESIGGFGFCWGMTKLRPDDLRELDRSRLKDLSHDELLETSYGGFEVKPDFSHFSHPLVRPKDHPSEPTCLQAGSRAQGRSRMAPGPPSRLRDGLSLTAPSTAAPLMQAARSVDWGGFPVAVQGWSPFA